MVFNFYCNVRFNEGDGNKMYFKEWVKYHRNNIMGISCSISCIILKMNEVCDKLGQTNPLFVNANGFTEEFNMSL